MNAAQLKERGNKLYSSRQYEDAIKCYTDAIVKNSSSAVFFTNRALCYLKLKKWQLAINDCHRAIEIDPRSVKAYHFLGEACLEVEGFDEAITSFSRANDLAKEAKLNFGDDIAYALRVAKKRRWNKIEEKRILEESELQQSLVKLIIDDKERKIESLKASSEEFIMQKSIIEEQTEKQINDVNELFNKIDDKRKKRDVPEYMCGKISFEVMKDPVITPSGITYDRKDIEEHLQRVGHFDPVSRGNLKSEQLIPNLAMKEVVDTFLEQNEWAEDY